MTNDRLMWHLENWRDWMQSDNHKLGYPTQSLCMVSGGTSAVDEFEIMCDEVDISCAERINSMIDSLSKPRQVAINHVWLKCPHHYPTQALDYDEALSALIVLSEKRKLD